MQVLGDLSKIALTWPFGHFWSRSFAPKSAAWEDSHRPQSLKRCRAFDENLFNIFDWLTRRVVETVYIYDKLAFSIIVVLRKWNCACPDCFPLDNFFLITQRHMWLSKISLPVLDAFESSSASILSFRLGFLDKSNLLKIPDCPAVDLKKVLSVTKRGFVFWTQRKANAILEMYNAFQGE